MNSLERLGARVDRLPAWAVAGSCLLLVLLVFLAELATGNQPSFSVFYLVPVSISSWFLGRPFGAAAALLAAILSTGAGLLAGPRFTHPAVAWWNGAALLVLLAVPMDLLVRLRHHVGMARRNARVDPLTGCLNARGFAERAAGVLDQGKRTGRPLTVVYLDLDNLKGINDGFGRSEGERLLQGLGQELAWNLRSYDLPARLGGDEFAILLPETGAEGGEAFLAKLRGRFVALCVANGWPVTMSAAVFTSQGFDGSVDDLLAAARSRKGPVRGSGSEGQAPRRP